MASMRDAAESILTDTAQIRRNVKASNGAGGFTHTTETVKVCGSSDIPCLLAPAKTSQAEGPQADSIAAISEWMFTFPAETDVRATDVIVHSSGEFDVIAVRERRSLEFVTRVVCKKTN